MANVMFKKGLLANLPETYAEGTFYVTTDERALYLDVDGSTRVRIGDFQEFATLAALQANTNPSTTALYYVAELNVLVKWDGSKYVQINLDTGATSAEKTGEGNALAGVSYDPATRKLTFTTVALPTAADVDNKIAAKVGDIGENTVKAYVDAKTSGIASDEALTALGNRVTTAEGKLDVLQGNDTVDGSVDKKIKTAISALQGDTEETLADVDIRLCTVEDNYVDSSDVNSAIATAIGANPDKKTVAELIADAKDAATYDDAALAGRVTTAEGKIDTLVGSDANKSVRTVAAEETAKIVAGADAAYDTLKEIADWISSHKSDATAMNSAIVALEAIVDGIGGEGEKATVVAYVNDAIGALKIGDYAKAADLTALAARVTALEGDTHTHANKALLDTYTQTEANLADAVTKKHAHANAAELNKIATGDKAKWDAAEQNAKDYADGLMTWGSF